MKHWLIIENKKEYEAALERAEELMDINPSFRSQEGRELKLLLLLIEKYEDEQYPIGKPDPVEAIKVRMEDFGLEPKDLIDAIGDKGTVSKVLNHKLPLSLRMIRNLSTLLQIPADVLIQEVNLKTA